MLMLLVWQNISILIKQNLLIERFCLNLSLEEFLLIKIYTQKRKKGQYVKYNNYFPFVVLVQKTIL